MIRNPMPVAVLGLLTAGLLGLAPLAIPGQDNNQIKPLQIGMAKSFFRDIPKVLIDFATGPFKEVMKTTTGLDGDLVSQFEASELAQKLDNNEFQLGVFHGHELAWMRQKYPKLRPLMVAVNRHHEVRSFIIVHKDNPAKSINDLRNQKFDLPKGTREQSRVFLTKLASDNAQGDFKTFFSAVPRSDTAEDALNEVARGNVQGTVVDNLALEFYKSIRKAVFEKNLRVLQQSESFPPPAIVYKEGVLGEAVLTKFRDGLVKADQTEAGRDMMKMWKIEAFEPTPADYARQLADILTAYPLSHAAAVSQR